MNISEYEKIESKLRFAKAELEAVMRYCDLNDKAEGHIEWIYGSVKSAHELLVYSMAPKVVFSDNDATITAEPV